jgi:hypothetical protein
MQFRDPLRVLQEKLTDLQHDPDESMWWTHEIGSDWRKQHFSEPKHSVPGWVMESYVPPESRILFYTLGSDATNLDAVGKRSSHPVHIIPGCFDAATRRKLSSSLLIAHLPRVHGTEERKAMFAAAMNVIGASLNHAGRHGVDMHIRLGETHVDCMCLAPARTACLHTGPGAEPTKVRVY